MQRIHDGTIQQEINALADQIHAKKEANKGIQPSDTMLSLEKVASQIQYLFKKRNTLTLVNEIAFLEKKMTELIAKVDPSYIENQRNQLEPLKSDLRNLETHHENY